MAPKLSKPVENVMVRFALDTQPLVQKQISRMVFIFVSESLQFNQFHRAFRLYGTDYYGVGSGIDVNTRRELENRNGRL